MPKATSRTHAVDNLFDIMGVTNPNPGPAQSQKQQVTQDLESTFTGSGEKGDGRLQPTDPFQLGDSPSGEDIQGAEAKLREHYFGRPMHEQGRVAPPGRPFDAHRTPRPTLTT